MKIVRFLQNHSPYVAGETAGFAPHVADVLIAGSSVFGRADRAAAIRDLREAAVA